MNSACVIAACSNGAYKKEHEPYSEYIDSDFNVFYVLKVRKYYHFEPMILVTNQTDLCTNLFGKYICQSDVLLKTVKAEPKSLFIEHHFSIYKDKCSNSIGKNVFEYVEQNIERFISSSVWDSSDEQALNTYIKELNRKYNITIDKNSLEYTNQFCWEVELDVR
jgi:hypothetical protein